MRVLIAEDEGLVALQMGTLVKQAGHEVVGPTPDVNEALMLVRSCHVDVALLDIWLRNDQFVWPLAHTLAVRGIPFAFVSARSPDGIDPEFRSTALFPKPVNEREVKNWLSSIQDKIASQQGG
jgi:response regulator of citrate/malate metabolism